ncbi:MAG TPA: hypothetical protein VF535_03480 [Allosphingosinicella sp.]|jgi:hypothetical protein
MRSFNILALCAATMMLGGVAVAKDKPAAKGEKKICRIEMPAVGRIPARKSCKTQAEWDAQSADSQSEAAQTLRSAGRRGY